MSDSSQDSIHSLGEFDTKFGRAYAHRRYYPDGTIAIQLYTKRDDLIATLSINIPGIAATLGSNEFAVRSWEENESLIGPALASGLFEDTGRFGPHICGHVPPIWRIRTGAKLDCTSAAPTPPQSARAP